MEAKKKKNRPIHPEVKAELAMSLSDLVDRGRYDMALAKMVLSNHPLILEWFPKMKFEVVNQHPEPLGEQQITNLKHYATNGAFVKMLSMLAGFAMFAGAAASLLYLLYSALSKGNLFGLCVGIPFLLAAAIALFYGVGVLEALKPDKGLGINSLIEYNQLDKVWEQLHNPPEISIANTPAVDSARGEIM